MRLGKDKQAGLLAVLLLFSASAGGQAGKSYKYQFDGNLQKSVVVSEGRSFTVNYSISELTIENIKNANGTFYRISIPGHYHTVVPGKPELPVYSSLITIPEGCKYKVKISDIISTRINPSGEKIDGILFPVQEGETKMTQQENHPFLIDKNEYASRGILKSDTVRIELTGILRNKQLANLYISPVRYNPHSNLFEVITSMKIEVTFSDADNTCTKSLFRESPLFNKSIDTEVLNYNPGEVIPGYSDQPVKMVIVTDTAFRKQLEPFFRWKTQKGYKLSILYKGAAFTGNNYVQLKDTLTKIYRGSSVNDPPPEYLLIIGDVNRIPYYGTENITDMYYGEFDGNGDYIPEMYIGRLPVTDTIELKSAVQKIIQYEKFQFADTNKFYTHTIASAGVDAGYASYMNGQVKYAVSNYLAKVNQSDEHHFYYPQSGSAKDSIIKLINNGVSFINYTGHGDATGWLHLNIKSGDTSLIRNKNMYPFIISNACRTAQFNTASSFGNTMFNSNEKGAIGFIGCSNDSYWDEDYFWAVGSGTPTADPTYLNKGLGAFDRLFHTHGESPSEWYFSMGQINYAGNMSVSESTTSRKKYYWETYNLIGDPSIIPIIGKPYSFNIVLPDTLPNRIKSLMLNAEPFSYVAVSHFDTLWDASFVSPSGSVVLNIPGLSNDSCLVVVTGQNKYPVIKTIYFTNFSREYINLTGTSINDSPGNNNGRADYGESFYLKLTVGNLGSTDAGGLFAKISSTSTWLTINNDSVLIGNLAGGSEIVIPDGLRMTLAANTPDMTVVTLKLVLKDQKTERHYVIDITVHSPELQIINCIIDDSLTGNGDFIADPGETVSLIFKVQNLGSSDISGHFAVASSNPEIAILQPSVKSGELKFGVVNDIPIQVKLSETILTGSLVSVSSTLDCSPFLINKEFSFRVGKVRESFEASSFKVFPWYNISTIPWTITATNAYDGTMSAKSGAISHNGTTSLMIRTFYKTADSIKFFYKVSSEAGYDNFSFKLNDKEVLTISGDIPWTRKVIAVPAGLNKMEWIYKKDQSVSIGADCAWIDMIDFTGSSPVTYINKDLQVVRLLTPVQKDKYGKETITATVRNLGKDIINGFFLAYSVNNDGTPEKQYFGNSVFYNDSVTVSFKTLANLSKYGIYKIVTYGVDNNDDYLFNDTVQVNIENVNLNEDLSVFPNPFTDQFTIYIKSYVDEKVQISITGLSGTKLFDIEKNILIGRNIFLISDARLLPGLYYLNIHGSLINKSLSILKINK